MNLPTVTYLFKERGINIHGMSITRRHMLSPLQNNLSNFLYVTDLDDTIQISHLKFMDPVFTSNKIDLQLYKEIYKIQAYNLKKRSVFSKEIASMENEISQYPKEKIFKKNKLYLERKLQNLDNNSMSYLVLVLILRNHVFELKKYINEKKGNQKDLLVLHQETNKSIKELISGKDELYVIVDKLKNEVEGLEQKASELDVIIETQKE